MSKFRIASLALAAAIGSATLLSTAPAAAQTAAASAAPQQMAESLVEAINGRRAHRRNWVFDHVASQRIRGAEQAKLDRLAIRYGEISLGGVEVEDDNVTLAISDPRGRNGAIRLTMDPNLPGNVLALNISGF